MSDDRGEQSAGTAGARAEGVEEPSAADYWLDQLIGCWSAWDSQEEYYLNVLAPAIVRSERPAELTPKEVRIVSHLRAAMSEAAWRQLPTLISNRREAREHDRQRLEDQKRQQVEAERQRRDHERERRAVAEQERLKEARQREEAERAERRQRALERKWQQDEEQAHRRRKEALVERIGAALEADFLTADDVLGQDADRGLIAGDQYQQLKARFIQAWAARELSQSLDSEQAAAIGEMRGDIQVVARAGSGKTRTLVTRAIFLQTHCRVPPQRLLLLAFNRKAADEMKSRLSETLGSDLPHVMTFHALAHAIVHPEEEIVFNEASTEQFGLDREVQEVIDEHVRSSEYGDRIRGLMLAHFREDWEHLFAGGFHLKIADFLAHRRSLPGESLRGDYVKSFGEKVIANALFEHGVEYRYERNFRWDDTNYRPDFTIPIGRDGGLVIEYFGLAGDADYDEASQAKRAFWAKREQWTFLELSPADLVRDGVEGFVQDLLQTVRLAGIVATRLPEESIWELVRRRALDTFTSAMRQFVGRCRKRGLAPEEVDHLIEAHVPSSTAEAAFITIGAAIYRAYLDRLSATGKEDFDGLMWRSVARISEGQTRFVRNRGREQGDLTQLQFVLVDEFQDFSQVFLDLVNAVRRCNPTVTLFCVGDDWQAINGFAGSDLKFFDDFGVYFHHTTQRHIRSNYRSPRTIVNAGNALMRGLGPGATAMRADSGDVRLCRLDEFTPTAPERTRHGGDEITPAVLRLIRRFLDRGSDVVLLSRRNAVPWYVNVGVRRVGHPDLETFLTHLRAYLPEDDRPRVTVSTAHRYKGREQSAVIVLDAVRRSFPLIHPNWVFLRVFGDTVESLEREERRLFYVAITRARQFLALITEKAAETPYIADIQQGIQLNPLSWKALPPVASLDGPRLEVRVLSAESARTGTQEIRDHLKDLKYSWHRAGRYWRRAVPAEGFSFAALIGQPWFSERIRVEVYSETGELLHVR